MYVYIYIYWGDIPATCWEALAEFLSGGRKTLHPEPKT